MDEASADAGVDQVMCQIDSVTLSCNDGEDYLWTSVPADPGLVGQDDQQSIRVSPAATTIYTVEVTNDCGFSAEDDVEVAVEKSVLSVSVTKVAEDEHTEYVHRGIAQRTFARNWELSDDTRVTDVSYTDGLLRITLMQEVPEEHKRRVLPIS